MKYLLVLAVLGVAFYLWRQGRPPARRDHAQPHATRHRPPGADTAPEAMVRCRHCGVHLPDRDAVRGVLGNYCGHEHRQLAEG